MQRLCRLPQTTSTSYMRISYVHHANKNARQNSTAIYIQNNSRAYDTIRVLTIVAAGSLENGALPRLARPKQENLEVISLGFLRLSCHVMLPVASHPIPAHPIPFRIAFQSVPFHSIRDFVQHRAYIYKYPISMTSSPWSETTRAVATATITASSPARRERENHPASTRPQQPRTTGREGERTPPGARKGAETNKQRAESGASKGKLRMLV